MSFALESCFLHPLIQRHGVKSPVPSDAERARDFSLTGSTPHGVWMHSKNRRRLVHRQKRAVAKAPFLRFKRRARRRGGLHCNAVSRGGSRSLSGSSMVFPYAGSARFNPFMN